MTQLAQQPAVTAADLDHFHREGYMILPGIVPAGHLELLRREAQYSMDKVNAEMDRQGTDVLGICHRGKRYFSAHVWKDRPQILEFIKSPLMAEVTRKTLGDRVWLFWEQYVIKCADGGMKFSWHQDSGYVHPDHEPYLTCWIALDDVSEDNGTVYVLPWSRTGIRTWVKHRRDPESNDLVGYFGDDPGVPVIGPAGTMAVFSSLVFHRSGPNPSGQMRRVYLAQYSREIVMTADRAKQWGAAEPVLVDGHLADWRQGPLSL